MPDIPADDLVSTLCIGSLTPRCETTYARARPFFKIQFTEGVTMISLTALWLPILLSAVIVFVASSIMHMVLPYHKSDYRQLPEEERVTDALRSSGAGPGRVYFFPYYSFKEMKSAPVIEKLKRGPVGLMTILPSGPPAIGKNLLQWFVYCIVIGIFVACLAGRMLPAGTDFSEVFPVVGLAALLGYGGAQAQESIWSGRSWVVTFKHVFDSVVFAGITAGTFGWLWPKLA
jgi:hypothetical protein